MSGVSQPAVTPTPDLMSSFGVCRCLPNRQTDTHMSFTHRDTYKNKSLKEIKFLSLSFSLPLYHGTCGDQRTILGVGFLFIMGSGSSVCIANVFTDDVSLWPSILFHELFSSVGAAFLLLALEL